MAKLLIQEPPLQVLPSLAVAIGLEEAIFLQQLHYLTNISRNERDGRLWVYNTAKQWQEDHFPWASDQVVRRVFKSLRDKGLVIATDKYNDMKMDKTLWYAIDYEAVEALEMPALKAIIPFVKNDESIRNNRRSNNQETTQETTQETRDGATNPREFGPWFERLWSLYPHYGQRSSKQDSLRLFLSFKPTPELCAKIKDAIELGKKSSDWTSEGGKFVPGMQVWLKKKTWESPELLSTAKSKNTNSGANRTLVL